MCGVRSTVVQQEVHSWVSEVSRVTYGPRCSYLMLSARSMTSALGSALLFGSVLGTIAYTGGTILGDRPSEPDMDKAAYKEEMRKRFRRPINELVNEIGEGRGTQQKQTVGYSANPGPGIYPPGYEGRRRERVKANYGIDVEEQPYYKGVSVSNYP
jgi:hypothetical protein